MNEENLIEKSIRPLIEIEPVSSDKFLQVAETLTRCGIKSGKEEKPTLWQSCHILHKNGKYYIVHFKELFFMQGKIDSTTITDVDYDRRDTIATNLEDWGLIKIKSGVNPDFIYRNIQIIPYKEKGNWSLKRKFSLGQKRNDDE